MLTLETLVDSLPSMPATGPCEEFMATAGWKRWQRAIDLVPGAILLKLYATC